jgi:tetratricopeptide (TPR) repeat protein
MPKVNRKTRTTPAPAKATDRAWSPVAGWPRAVPWLAALALLLAVWIVYARALDAPFIFDDTSSVDLNDSIRRLWPPIGTAEQPGALNPAPFSSTSGRPVVNLSLAINYYFGAMSPWGYHLLNVLVHCLSALVLAAIVRRTLLTPYFGRRFENSAAPLGWVTALLWAVHPLQTEAVIYVTQRTELFMAFFYLATLFCSLRYWAASPATARAAWLTLAVAACAGGMASKEVMVSAPVMVLLYERTFIAGSLQKSLRDSWPLYLGLASTWGLLMYLNIHGPRSDSVGFHLEVPAYAWWFTQAKVLLMYLKLVVWPWPLVIHYEMPYLDSPLAAAPFVLPVAVLAIGTLFLLWRGSAVGYVGAWVFAILAPTLVVPINTEVAAERRMYLPLAAIAALAVVGTYDLAERVRRRQKRGRRTTETGRLPYIAVFAPALVIAIVLAGVSVRRLAAYQAPIVLWQQAVDYEPRNHIAQQNLGVELAKVNRYAEAIARYQETLRLKPDQLTAHNNLGLAGLETRDFDLAIHHFRELVRLEPASEVMRNNLAVALVTADRLDEAIVEFEKTLALNPRMWKAHDNLGDALKRTGRLSEAIKHYEKAVELNPDALEVYGHLADACARAKQPAKAIAAAERAFELAQSAGQYETAATIATQLAAFRASQPTTNVPEPSTIPPDRPSSQ